MRIRLTVLLAALSITMMLVSPTLAKDWKTVRIATEGAYPPFNSVDSNGDRKSVV